MSEEEINHIKRNNSIGPTMSPKQHKVMILDSLAKKRGSVAVQPIRDQESLPSVKNFLLERPRDLQRKKSKPSLQLPEIMRPAEVRIGNKRSGSINQNIGRHQNLSPLI